MHFILLNKQCLERLEREALNYICTCRDNFSSLRTLRCRLEFVLVPTQVTSNIDPCSYINGDHLSRLLEKEALLVPFDITDDTLCLALRGIGEYLVKTLSMCFTNGKRLGGYENTRKAYQAELAIEKFLWGRPLLLRSTKLNQPGSRYSSPNKKYNRLSWLPCARGPILCILR